MLPEPRRHYHQTEANRRAAPASRDLPEETMGSAIPAGWVAIHVGFYRRALEIDAMTVPLAHTVHDGRWLVLGFAGSSSAGQSNRLEKLARQMMRCSRRTCGRCGRRTCNGAHGAWSMVRSLLSLIHI